MDLSGILIRRDDAGRYNLNDLHKAAGGEKKDQPNHWLVVSSTAELIAELSNSRNSGIKPVAAERGRYEGTFVCKELVYAYAMWVSASFHLKVIRAYDSLVTAPAAPADSAG